MSVFSEIITKALNDYKSILKKDLSPEQRAARLSALGLRRRELKQSSTVVLYKKAKQVLKDIENTMASAGDEVPSWYCGLQAFYQHLQDILADYQVSEDTVVHITQESSRALINAIQLVSLTDSRLDSNIAKKLDQCGKIVAKFGSKQQQEKLVYVLKLHKERNTAFFMPLLYNLEKYLSQPSLG